MNSRTISSESVGSTAMNHDITHLELQVTSQIDFVVPLKQVGIVTRAVLEAIFHYHNPRRIIVVTPRTEVAILGLLVPYWNVSRVECMEEESFFKRNYNLSLPDIVAQYDATRGGDQREPGWWIQQLIKLGAASQIPHLSKTYVVWDGDLVPTRRWRLCEVDSNGKIQFRTAILQAESRSAFNVKEYANCMKALIGYDAAEPEGGGTFVPHHMVFETECVKEMLNLMVERTSSDLCWPLLIMSYSRKFYRFSEYKTYATFMLNKHPGRFLYHPLQDFGCGGIRFRQATDIIGDLCKKCPASHGGFSFPQLQDFVAEHWQDLADENYPDLYPPYIQLEHVYGLEGLVDLSAYKEVEQQLPPINTFNALLTMVPQSHVTPVVVPTLKRAR